MRSVIVSTVLFLLAGPALAAPPITAPTEAIVDAVRKGDEALMKRLTGTNVALTAETTRTLRIGTDYHDVLAVTGPDFKLAGGRSGIEVILRIPNRLLPAAPPPQLTSAGTVTGFELRGDPAGTPGPAVWVPVVTVSLLK